MSIAVLSDNTFPIAEPSKDHVFVATDECKEEKDDLVHSQFINKRKSMEINEFRRPSLAEMKALEEEEAREEAELDQEIEEEGNQG